MNYAVYMHITPNNKKYIGITCQKLNQRFQNGLGYRKCPYFMSAIKKYGWDNIKHKTLFENLSKEDAEKKEIELISQYKSNDRRYGYNIANGGNCKGTVSEETKDKIRKSKIGKTPSLESRIKMSISQKNISAQGRKNKSISHLGKKHSVETKIKIGKAHKNKVNSKEAILKMISSKLNKSKKIFQYDINKNFIKEWSSASRIEAETNYYKSHIVKCANGKKQKAYGFIWSYTQL